MPQLTNGKTTSPLVVSSNAGAAQPGSSGPAVETRTSISTPRSSPAAENGVALAGAAPSGEENKGATLPCGATLQSFSSLLISRVGGRVGSAPPSRLVAEQYARLAEAGATLHQFSARLGQRERAFHAWPFLRVIIDDVVGLAQAQQRAAATAQTGPTIPPSSAPAAESETRAQIQRIRQQAANAGIQVPDGPLGRPLSELIDEALTARVPPEEIAETMAYVRSVTAERTGAPDTRPAHQVRADAIVVAIERLRRQLGIERLGG